MISRKADYAIRIMAEISLSNEQPLSVRKISETQDIPYAFARSIQHALIRAELVISKRGSQGGIQLARAADEITLLDIVEAVDGKIITNECTSEDNWCNKENHCLFYSVWNDFNQLSRDYLSSVSIKEILEGKLPKDVFNPVFK